MSPCAARSRVTLVEGRGPDWDRTHGATASGIDDESTNPGFSSVEESSRRRYRRLQGRPECSPVLPRCGDESAARTFWPRRTGVAAPMAARPEALMGQAFEQIESARRGAVAGGAAGGAATRGRVPAATPPFGYMDSRQRRSSARWAYPPHSRSRGADGGAAGHRAGREADLCRDGGSFRPEVDAKMALRRVLQRGRAEACAVVDADLSDYFQHNPLQTAQHKYTADDVLLSRGPDDSVRPRPEPSVHAAYRKLEEQFPVSDQSVYNKLQRRTGRLSAALWSVIPPDIAPVIRALRTSLPPLWLVTASKFLRRQSSGGYGTSA